MKFIDNEEKILIESLNDIDLNSLQNSAKEFVK